LQEAATAVTEEFSVIRSDVTDSPRMQGRREVSAVLYYLPLEMVA